MLTVFITSNQIPLHVHAVFCQLHVHCIHLARGMMRMRIPSSYMIAASGLWSIHEWLSSDRARGRECILHKPQA